MDARRREAAETGRSIRRIGRSRSPGPILPANQLRPLPPVQRRRDSEHRAGDSRLPLAATQTVGIRPIQGTFGIAGARIIAPGDPARSVLYYRMSKLGGGRMPRVGSNQVDERATRMIHDWIARCPTPGGSGRSRPSVAAEDRDALEALRKPDQLSPERTHGGRPAAGRRQPAAPCCCWA